MKTIKEAAKEYANRIDKANSEFVEEDFKAGVEFSQKWIDVNVEHPPSPGIEDCILLLKTIITKNKGKKSEFIFEKIITGRYHSFQFWNIENSGSPEGIVTHWREIELK